MKLVDILARELSEWPADGCSIHQGIRGNLFTVQNGCLAMEVEKADDWLSAEVTRIQWQAAVDALKAGEEFVPFDFSGPVLDYGSKEWTGKGLPPVGTVCEWHGPNSDGPNGWVYAESKVVAYTEDGLFVCMQAPSCWPVVQRVDNCEFRPIRTPEQLAAKAREAAIKDLMRLDDIYYEQAAAIYDAGYRRVSP